MLNPIFGGISGARLPIDEYDLGEGVTLKAIYAHVMAPFLVAFSPAEPGKPHPAPWSAVKGGLAHDVHIELRIDSAGNPEWLMGPRIVVDGRTAEAKVIMDDMRARLRRYLVPRNLEY